jgi:hypothetical protein
VKGGDRIALPLSLPADAILHFLGYPRGRGPAERIAARLEVLLGEARELAAGRGAYHLLEPAEASQVGLEPIPEARLVIGLVSAGDGIERRASELMEAGDSVGALILDAAGSAAAEEAADRLGAIIAGGSGGEADASTLSCRISPGYGRWDLSSQPALFRRLPHEELGVSLMPSMLMLPRKSVSFAMWLGADARPLAGLSGCAHCELASCRYRKEPASGGSPE